MKLNFKISELIYSDTAIKHNINNMPDIKSLDNLLDLIFYCLQPIRDKLNKPMIITSGYRCPAVNKLVGGKNNSQHLKGEAADFIVKGMTPKQIIEIIKNSKNAPGGAKAPTSPINGCEQTSAVCSHPGLHIEFDQLINEHDKWVHISFSKNKNRKQILKI